MQMGIELDRKSLSNIAIWEPRTFKSLVEIAKKFDEKDFELKWRIQRTQTTFSDFILKCLF